MWITVIFGIGALVGGVILIIFRGFLAGSLRIDTSDPEDSPYMFLELLKDLNSITQKKYVILKVNTNNFIPRK
jgi:hypothetical protein